jgi:tRNA threonylcarbamoyl adenosine modification protein (Sua5/YciO/YrdC/YwlC family)
MEHAKQPLAPQVAIAADPAVPESLTEDLRQVFRDRGITVVVGRFDATREAVLLSHWATRQENAGARVHVALCPPPGLLATLLCACTRRPVVLMPVTGGCAGEPFVSVAPVAMVTPDAPGNVVILVERMLDMPPFAQGGKPAVAPAEPPAAATREAARTEDCAWVEELARNFRPRLPRKTVPRAIPPRRPPLDYSPALRAVLSAAREIAGVYSGGAIHAVHLLAGILDSPDCAARAAIERAGGRLDRIAAALTKCFPESEASGVSGALATDAAAILSAAKERARAAGRVCMTTLDFLAALMAPRGSEATKALRAGLPSLKRLSTAMDDPALPDETEPLRRQTGPIGRPVEERRPTADRAPAVSIPGAPPPRESPVEDHVAPSCASPASAAAREPLTPAPEIPRSGPFVARKTITLPCNPDDPSLEVVEAACEVLLEGGLVVLPCDTMLGLAADATNPAAVGALRAAAGVEPGRPVGVLIHSTAVLRHLTGTVTRQVESLLEDLWPGPLTVVFPRRAGVLDAVAPGPSLGVRVPADYLSLAILSMLGRPLAVARLGSAEQAPAAAGIILDTGRAPAEVTTTVLSVVEVPHRIIREGAVERSRIEAALGARLAD